MHLYSVHICNKCIKPFNCTLSSTTLTFPGKYMVEAMGIKQIKYISEFHIVDSATLGHQFQAEIVLCSFKKHNNKAKSGFGLLV